MYQNGKCGGTKSEWMHCNGFIGFSALKSGNIEPDAIENKIEEPTFNDDFMVYPNPVNDIVNISISRMVEGACKAELFNLSGSLVMSLNLVTGTNTVDIKDLTTGMYIVRIYMNEEIITRKIVKRK